MGEQIITPTATADAHTSDRVRQVLLIAAIVGGVYLCYRMALPFVPSLAWALGIGVLVAPIHSRLERWLGGRAMGASASVIIVAVIVAVPAMFVIHRLIFEAAKGAELVKASIETDAWAQALNANPRLAPIADWVNRQFNLPQMAGNAAAWLANSSASFVRLSFVQLGGMVLTFYLLFYFLRDRGSALVWLRGLSPLSETEMDTLFERVVDTVHATLYGTVAIAIVQGTLGGLMFWWLGLPAPMLWGLMMALLAIVPVFGAFIVWIPAAIYLAIIGHWGQALTLAIWGGFVVSTIDNVLYPMLVGNRLKQHTVVAFIALVGGVTVFGSSGLILGPVVAAVTMLLLEIWQARLRHQ